MHAHKTAYRRWVCQGCHHGLFPMLFGSEWSLSCRHRPGTQTNLISGKKAVAESRWIIARYLKVFYVLRTGCQWKALPKEIYGSPSSVHAYFRQWEKAGVFLAIWRAGLAEYDEMEGISWLWQSIDSAMTRAPLAQEAVGPSPTDRGKKRQQTPFAGRRAWRPSVDRRNRG
jgi:transposase